MNFVKLETQEQFDQL
ncbi:Protein of unknown function [Bacillus mycoides]|nr:Protein of unknown function [Bacillus mycoides]